MLKEGKPKTQIAVELKVNRNTLYRFIKNSEIDIILNRKPNKY